jgi:CBS domain-containing protein
VKRKVSDLMTRWPVALPLEATLDEAARLMRDQGIGDVLVTAEGMLCGMLTDRDIVIRAVAQNLDLGHTALSEVCTAQVVTVSADDDAAVAMELMRDRAIRRLPVVQGRQPVGIISLGDLAIEQDEQSALSEISKAPPNM